MLTEIRGSHVRTHGSWARMRHVSTSAISPRTTICVQGRVCVYIMCVNTDPSVVCRSMTVRRGNRTRTHVCATPYRQPTHTGTLVCMGEAPTHTPAHGIAQKSYLHIFMYRSLYTGHMGGEGGTHAVAARARTARARIHTRICSGGCMHGRSTHA